MKKIICIFQFFILVLLTIESRGDEIWKESFDIPDKGFWGDADGKTVHSDMTNIEKWGIDVSSCQLTATNDYVKTTSTSGGRLEAVDCDGEAVWTSESISIKDFKNISIQINVSETGSGANVTSKYIKLYYSIDNGPETLFETNGENTGNFGSALATQSGLNGENLRIFIRMNTSYASDKLIADEITVEGESKTVFSPNHISAVDVLSGTEIKVSFADEILPASVAKENFRLQGKSGLTVAVSGIDLLDSTNKNVGITATPSGKDMVLIVSGLTDKAGLPMKNDTVSFEWVVPCAVHSVVINEIMADPYPAVDLPEYEYIELFNRTNAAIWLKQLQLVVSGKTLQLPDSVLAANGYVVLTSAEADENYSNAVAVKQFPALKNEGCEISLLSNEEVIDEVSYSDSWYNDSRKEDGGWSLERIDPNRFCDPENNWTASVNPTGGTPGSENSVKKENTDETPPQIVFLNVTSANQIDISFSEQIDSECLSNTGNYFIEGTDNYLDSVEVVSSEQVSLFFHESFTPKTNYTLGMHDLTDLCGNPATNKSSSFMYYEPEEHDLVFTEVFPDPSPSVALPEYEYIEIFNRSGYPVPLNKIDLVVDTKQCSLGEKIIQPEEYLVLTSEEGASFLPCGLPVSSFPSLRNSTATIQLLYNGTRQIDQLTYSDNWYNDSRKQDGGWSLERIDPNRFCGPENNWTASVNPSGGTPGTKNSVSGNNQDTLKPEITDYEILSASEIKLTFSENITTETLESSGNYLLSPDAGYPAKTEVTSRAEVKLIFSEDLTANTDYTLRVSGLSDECGNLIEETSLPVTLVQLENGDVLISEVLFNPYPGEADFVEIYNHSDKAVNLKNLELATRDDELNIEEVCPVSNKNRWMNPGEFVLFTPDSLSVIRTYYTICPECFCETEKFPSYPDDAGAVVLLDDSLQVIDEFEYSEKMQHPLLDDVEGVSLERLSYETATSDETNWHSAASSVGFATPGYTNSQYRSDLSEEKNITLSPKIFSPNNDGYNDRLFIHYRLEKSGYSANVKIFDSRGRLVNSLAKNEILAQEGEWYWDGVKSDNSRSALGIYIVLVELFDLDGNVKRYKKTCTLTDRL